MKRVFTQTFGVAAAIIEKDGQILLVHEAKGPDIGKWNAPGGWVDIGEDLLTAVEREVEEESGYEFTPASVLGIYSIVRGDLAKSKTEIPHAIKIVFTGAISSVAKPLHEDISETKWFNPDEIYSMNNGTLRDLDIKQMVKDYLNGVRFPLDILHHALRR